MLFLQLRKRLLQEKEIENINDPSHKIIVENLFPEFCFFQYPFLCYYVKKEIVPATEVDFSVGDRLNKLIFTMLLSLSILHKNGLVHRQIVLKNIYYYPEDDCFFLCDYSSIKENTSIACNNDLQDLANLCLKIQKTFKKAYIFNYYKFTFINNPKKYIEANQFLESLEIDFTNFKFPKISSMELIFDKKLYFSSDNKNSFKGEIKNFLEKCSGIDSFQWKDKHNKTWTCKG